MNKEQLKAIMIADENDKRNAFKTKEKAVIEYIKEHSIQPGTEEWQDFIWDNDLEDRYEDEERTVTAGMVADFGTANCYGDSGIEVKDWQYIYYSSIYVITDNETGKEQLGIYWSVNSGREETDNCEVGHDEVTEDDLNNIMAFLTKDTEADRQAKKKAADVLTFMEEEWDSTAVIRALEPLLKDEDLAALYDDFVEKGIIRV